VSSWAELELGWEIMGRGERGKKGGRAWLAAGLGEQAFGSKVEKVRFPFLFCFFCFVSFFYFSSKMPF
jgi:hypothetical protein